MTVVAFTARQTMAAALVGPAPVTPAGGPVAWPHGTAAPASRRLPDLGDPQVRAMPIATLALVLALLERSGLPD